MKTRDNLRMALEGLAANPLRSVLTTLGVIIGVTAVIVMTALGEGASRQVTAGIEGLGSNLLIITPGRTGRRSRELGAAGSATTVTSDLLPVLERELAREGGELLRGIAPEARQVLPVRNASLSITTNVMGVTPAYLGVRGYDLKEGAFFNEEDLERRNRLAVLGKTTAEELFGEESPVGQVIRIANNRFTVIGVLAERGYSGFSHLDDLVLVPLTTAQRRLFGHNRLQSIYLEVVDSRFMDAAYDRVDRILRGYFQEEAAYSLSNQVQILETIQSTTRTFTLLLAGIASVSLLVGGIGIMNIMLVSVTERIREIGIRKALGAQGREILLQFLFEAIVLSLAGGGIGILLGLAGSRLAALFGGWPAVVSGGAILLAFAFAFGVGLFFGVYPAYKAALLPPAEALRHE
ncbi:MAG: FtsX-like permease family protein [Firmicutes bacterium]|nr:FtsX-like permease family protein [Bacillota bacterium]